MGQKTLPNMLGKNPEKPNYSRLNAGGFCDLRRMNLFYFQKNGIGIILKRLLFMYSKVGNQGHRFGLCLGCLLLKHLYNLGDETLEKAWIMNPYMQLFLWQGFFEHRFPCGFNFVSFRKELAKKVSKKIFCLQRKNARCQDNTSKFCFCPILPFGRIIPLFLPMQNCAKKVIDYCNKIAENEGKKTKTTLHKSQQTNGAPTPTRKHPKRAKADEISKTAQNHRHGRLIRELQRNFNAEQQEFYKRFNDIVHQGCHTKETMPIKFSAFHKPFTRCICQGKSA